MSLARSVPPEATNAKRNMRLVLFLMIPILAGCDSGPTGGSPYGYSGGYRGDGYGAYGYGGLALGGYGFGGGYPGRHYNDPGYKRPYFYPQNRQLQREEHQQEFQRRQLRQQQFGHLSQQRQIEQQQFQKQHAAPPTLPATRPPTPSEGRRLLDQLGIRPRSRTRLDLTAQREARRAAHPDADFFAYEIWLR